MRFLQLVICEGDDDKFREEYVLGRVGVLSFGGAFPFLVDIPAAPTGFPADLSEAEADKLSFERGVAVATFVRDRLNAL